MNIFYLSSCRQAAKDMCDQHIVKMPLGLPDPLHHRVVDGTMVIGQTSSGRKLNAGF